MRPFVTGILLFILQLYFTFQGVRIFGKYLNPLLLLITSVSIVVYLVHLSVNQTFKSNTQRSTKFWNRALWAIPGVLIILVAYEELRKVFLSYVEYEKWSDVIPQVSILYERWSRGEFAYAPIDFTGYTLQPVYMPFHWMPSGLALSMHIDIRWIGFCFLAISVGIYGWYLAMQANKVGERILILVLPSIPLWAFIQWGKADLGVSYEIIIGAYYLVLATGLIMKRLWLVIVGIILCLLSRYTFLFWLPLFALLLYVEKGWKKSILVWGTAGVFVIAFYVIPFYLKDPTMLSRGLSYYDAATVAEWNGYGNPPVSWTHENGISFAPHMKDYFKGDMAHRVQSARVVQIVMLLTAFMTSLWAYRRWRKQIDWFTFSLIALYVFLMVYYFFAPLTYRYYLFSFLMVSAVLCGKIMMYHIPQSGNEDAIEENK